MKPDLAVTAAACLRLKDPQTKCGAVFELAKRVERNGVAIDPLSVVEAMDAPGRPPRPELVDPSRVPRRRLGSSEGRAALVHAIAHIEFNAINLALDAVCRFREMPQAFYRDWISVAADEARHFLLLNERLQELGKAYGDFPAHGGLWEMAQKTTDSCLARMALVPRVLEARGLDVTPGMIDRLESVGDEKTIAALRIILDEEVRHVAIGTHWFNFCCQREGVDSEDTFLQLLKERFPSGTRGPFNLVARFEAGFTVSEMDRLTAEVRDSAA